jgi:hypothetical protein
MTLQHVSAVLKDTTRHINRQTLPITWKEPGEKNFKFDYIRVLKETEMPTHLKYTALHLATSFYTGGDVKISFKTLARHMGVTPRTVQNNVNTLVKLGWITRASGRVGKTNTYQGVIPSHLPSVAAAMERLQEQKRKTLGRKTSTTPPDTVVRFIARLYENKGLSEHLEQDLIEKSMNTLRKTVTALLDYCGDDYDLAHKVIARLAQWPLQERISSRPHMFNGGLHYLLPNLQLASRDASVPLILRPES